MDIRVAVLSIVYASSILARQAVFVEQFTDLAISQVCGVNEPISCLHTGCKRSHQALFNEVCDVLEDKGAAVRIALSNVIYGIKKNELENMSAFMAPRQSLVFLDECDSSLFPAPLTPDYFKQLSAQGATVVLTAPWRDHVTKKDYSAATRFVRTHKDTDKHYGIVLYDAQHKKKAISRVPKDCARVEAAVYYDDAQKEFVQLLYSWARLSKGKGVIPYVWGGSSFVYMQKDGDFFQDNQSCWCYNTNIPATGYDCSELVLRATQICGIPYFYKTTAVLSEYMRPLAVGEEIAAGDLLWYPGHVMVVGDITRNELIESRGYPTGYGKVHVVELNKLFPDIVTYDDLKKKHLTKEPFKLVCKDGSANMVITTFKIFKLSGAWVQQYKQF